MFLVHAVLRPPSPGTPALPVRMSHWVWCCVRTGQGIEHVSLHRQARPYPTVGLFLSTRCLAEAEHQAERLLRRTLHRHVELAGWGLLRAEGALLRPELVWPEPLDR